MIYNIEGDLKNDDVFSFTTDLGAEYRIVLKDGGEYRFVEITIISESKYNEETFSTYNTIKNILVRSGFTKFIITINNGDIYFRRRILNIYKRWLDQFDMVIVENPHLPPMGRDNYSTVLDITQVFLTQKKEINKKKYCPNCGSENIDYKFCPSCGTNLQ
jgi:hypothetical protein